MPAHVIVREVRGREQLAIKWRRPGEKKWRRQTPARVADLFGLADPGANRRKVERLARTVADIVAEEHSRGEDRRRKPGTMPMSEAVDAFVAEAAREKSWHTETDRRRHMRSILDHWGPLLTVGKLTPELVRATRDWIVTRPRRHRDGSDREGRLKPTAANAILRVLRVFCSFVAARHWTAYRRDELAEACPTVTQDEPRPAWIKRADARRLLEAALVDRRRAGRYVALGLLCPFRPTELLSIRWGDVFLDGTEIEPHIVVATSKTHRGRRVPLWHAPELRAWLAAEREDDEAHVVQALSGGLLKSRQWWPALAKRARVNARAKDLRSNACSRLASWRRGGASVFNAHDLARAAGHSVQIAARHYVELLRSQGSEGFEGEVGVAGVLSSHLAADKHLGQ